MPKTVQKEKSKTDAKVDEAEKVEGLSDERQAEIDKKKSDVDDLLDDIDGLLEEVGQDLAVNYIQKGGQ